MRFPAFLLLTTAIQAAGLAGSDEFRAAEAALADGLPEVAGVKAERLLQRQTWTRAEVRDLATFAAEAWARARSAEQVLKLAEAHDLHEESFWRAQALVLRGDLAEAREELVSSRETRTPKARLLLAQILTALGEHDAAPEELEPLLEQGTAEERQHARLLLAEIDIAGGRLHAARQNLDALADPADPVAGLLRTRCHLLAGEVKAARESLQGVLDATRGGERNHHAAAVLMAEVLLLEKLPEQAWEHLIKHLDSAAVSSMWTEAFNLLDRAWLARPEPRSIPEPVLAWILRGNTAQQTPATSPALAQAISEFSGHAAFICARWLVAQERDLEATGLLESLLQLHPDHPRTNAALRLAIEIYTRLKADDRALALAEVWRAQFGGETGSTRVDFLAGDIYFRRGDYLQAQDAFQGAANMATTLSERRRALFNAAVAAVQGGDLVLYLGLLAQLEVAGGTQAGTTDSAADLELDKALQAAAGRQDGAEDALRTFLTARPYHPRRVEAQIALAEWMLLASPPRVPEAQAMLDAIQLPANMEKNAATDSLRQRIDYTRLWLREASGDLKAVITEGPAFAKNWPASPLLVDVLMKTASAHFQLEDFASARTQFEIIAKAHPGSPHADSALYFAALSAMSVMSAEGRERALGIWEDLGKKGGPLAIPARRQQALVLRRQGDLAAALKVLDQILATSRLDRETRRLTLCEKAEVLLLNGKKEPKSLEDATKLLRSFLTEDDSLPLLWRARAGFTLATVLHDAGSDAEALEACYDVLRAADTAPPANPAEYLWFTKAGFFGIELLEAAHQWEPAARLAEQIAELPGDRAQDARQLATKIRLAHFLWDGPKPTPPVQPAPAPAETKSEPKTEPKSAPGKKKTK
jgi:hypothetical protein